MPRRTNARSSLGFLAHGQDKNQITERLEPKRQLPLFQWRVPTFRDYVRVVVLFFVLPYLLAVLCRWLGYPL